MSRSKNMLILLYTFLYVILIGEIINIINLDNNIISFVFNMMVIYLFYIKDDIIENFLDIQRVYIRFSNEKINKLIKIYGVVINFLILIIMLRFYQLGLYDVIVFFVIFNMLSIYFIGESFFDYISLKNWEEINES